MLVVRIRDKVACAGIRRVNCACTLTDPTKETTMKSKPMFDQAAFHCFLHLKNRRAAHAANWRLVKDLKAKACAQDQEPTSSAFTGSKASCKN
jgi:hypothetical protein